MRIFVLSTGRCGSTTFAKACQHATNVTAAHQSNFSLIGPARFDFPDDHVEVDNRLSWFLGPLHRRYPQARYVHLTRDREATARSYRRKWPAPAPRPRTLRQRIRGALVAPIYRYDLTIIRQFGATIVFFPHERPENERIEVARFYVDVVNANISEFLSNKPHLCVRLEETDSDFPAFWRWAGLEGDLDAAMREWSVRHNAG